MKIAILSDIHGNVPALHAVMEHLTRWQPDQVVVNGDTVNRGPASMAAWQFVQRQPGWHLLKGNHEDYLIEHQNKGTVAQNGRIFSINYMSYWTFLQHQRDVTALAKLADGLSLFAPDGTELRLRHASMKHNRDGIWPNAEVAKVQGRLGTPPAVFATAHIHLPFVRQVRQTLVVNSGSVGTPIGGDWRASYAQITWQQRSWAANIVRLAYDRGQTRQQYATSGFLAEAGPVGWLVFHEWEQATGVVYPWLAEYYEAVVAGEIELETAVTRYLTRQGLAVPWG
ncbi:MAG: metallophosphoesterase family protein [Ardenticatenaceae bacterium]|nr:metallophosphoesterase family protein [Anaerolineales bacterium]MCB8941475.1 metallophosphoesterase family protein [Ardenticatenaceae bacterium]MCB8974631.1 metallophosphoesterase family protein [Ardenticatenaceae bacterium]